MHHTHKRGRNRDRCDPRSFARDEGGTIVTEAEFCLAVGRLLKRLVRRGVRIETLARQYHISVSEGLSAVQYADSSPAMILRALIEDWTWDRIKRHLGWQPKKV